MSVLILLLHHLWSISTDPGCCSIYRPNSEGCLKFDPIVTQNQEKLTAPAPASNIIALLSTVAFKSVLAICL